MGFFIEQYGKILVAVMTGVLMAAVTGGIFLSGWRANGGVSDSIKTNFQTNEVKRTPPVLLVKDFKIKRGEKADFSKFLSASDYDGRDITSEIKAAKQGEGVGMARDNYQNLFQTYGSTVWKEEGVLRFSLKVKSPVTGKTAEGKLIVLVDAADEGAQNGDSV